nr:protein argonaute 5 [Ipomoea batatas]
MDKLASDYKQTHLGNRMLAYDGVKSGYTAGELSFQSKDFVVKLVDDNGSSRGIKRSRNNPKSRINEVHKPKKKVAGNLPSRTTTGARTAKAFSPSNCYNEEQREVCRIEQPPERGIIDAAREWVSTRSGRIFVVDEDCSTANTASSSIAHCRRTCRAKKRERTLDYYRWIASRNFPLLTSPIAGVLRC